jgi:hypothetical protein
MSKSPDLTVLPSRDRLEEDRYVAAWRDAEELHVGVLVDRVTDAIDARRPMLAARLVGLLDDDVAADDPNIARARSAARLLMRTPDRVDPAILEDFMAAWRRGRKMYMDRVRRRHRARQGQKRPRQPRRR